MSTQEREAMERLAQLDPSESNWREVYESDDPYDVSERQTTDQLAVITAALSRHARSLQPITVEGLVAMGFTRDKEDDAILSMEVGNWRVGCLEQAVSGGGEPRIVCWSIEYDSIPSPFRPQTMLDVDNLIERLSR